MILSASVRGERKPDRPALVFLHAFPLDSRMWENQMEMFAEQFFVIAPDFEGFGQTRMKSEKLSFESFARDVRETLEYHRVTKAVFAGCSMGGYTIFELWRQKPELVAGMILCDTRAEADTDEARGNRAQMMKNVREHGIETVVQFVTDKLLGETSRRERPHLVVSVNRIVRETPVESVLACLQALADRMDSGPTLPTINVDTLVIVGEEDTVTPPSAADRLAREIPGAMIETIVGAGHLAPLEQPEIVNMAMDHFLREF